MPFSSCGLSKKVVVNDDKVKIWRLPVLLPHGFEKMELEVRGKKYRHVYSYYFDLPTWNSILFETHNPYENPKTDLHVFDLGTGRGTVIPRIDALYFPPLGASSRKGFHLISCDARKAVFAESSTRYTLYRDGKREVEE